MDNNFCIFIAYWFPVIVITLGALLLSVNADLKCNKMDGVIRIPRILTLIAISTAFMPVFNWLILLAITPAVIIGFLPDCDDGKSIIRLKDANRLSRLSRWLFVTEENEKQNLKSDKK